MKSTKMAPAVQLDPVKSAAALAWIIHKNAVSLCTTGYFALR